MINSLAVLSESSPQLLGIAINNCNSPIELVEFGIDEIPLNIYDDKSTLYTKSFDFIYLNFSSEKLLSDFCKLDPENRVEFFTNKLRELKSYFETLIRDTNSRIIFNSYREIPDPSFGNFGLKVTDSWSFQVKKMNFLLMEFSASNGRMLLLDSNRIFFYHGYNNLMDFKFHYLYGFDGSLEYQDMIAKNLVQIIDACTGGEHKVLILDLDNTIWGGEIGDCGVSGIKLGDFGTGKVYTQIQNWAKSLKNRGVLLAVCSKNEREVAIEPFVSHAEMVLELADIAVFVANWESKAENIAYIQSVLNVSFESMVFVDDNPFERNLVRMALPDVVVPELPDDPALFLNYLLGCNLFETGTISKFDAQRTLMYQNEAVRKESAFSFNNVSDYLKSLDMEMNFRLIHESDIPRASQLTQRTNQFNLTGVRETTDGIIHKLSNGNWEFFTIHLKDKFGEYGMVSLVAVEILSEKSVRIDNWTLSCRVFKRGLEKAIIDCLAKYYLKKGVEEISGRYIPSAKNGIISNLLEELGFMKKSANDKGFELDLSGYINQSENILFT